MERSKRSATSSAAEIAECQRVFAAAVATFRDPALILAHHDADGLSSAAILVRALRAVGRQAEVRIVGRGENAWSEDMHSELANRSIGGLIVVDLGVRAGELRKGTPTVVLDHHVPQGAPTGASLVTGFGMNPIPTSSLLAFWCASALTNVEDLVWLAAIGVIGDMAEKHEFAEMKRAKSRYGVTVLREAAVLVNQPRRSSSGEAAPALALLLKASTPGEITSGEHPETAQLIAARNEVKSELERVRKTAPRISGRVALIRFASACQIHPLVAQMWSRRMRGRIVMVANTGFRPGWVHFAARSHEDIDLVEFLREHAPSGADASYGGGHRNASGGALRAAQWNEFIRKLGFERDMEVS